MNLPKIFCYSTATVLTIVSLSLLTSSPTQAKKRFEVHSYIEGGVNIVNGYSQVPLDPTAASASRPSFAELDIDSDLYFGISFDIKNDDIWTRIHYQQLTPSNTAILTTALDTLGQTVPAGTTFAMHSHYKWIGGGFGKEYIITSPCLRLTPMIDFNWVDYLYSFSYPVNMTGRKELSSLFALRLGAQLDYQYRDMWSWKFMLMGSPPVASLNIYEAKLSVSYHLYERNNFKIRPYAGLSWLLLDINDNKAINLHTRYEAKPSLFVGFHFTM